MLNELDASEGWFQKMFEAPDVHYTFTFGTKAPDLREGILQSCLMCSTRWYSIFQDDREECELFDQTSFLSMYHVALTQDEETSLPKLDVETSFENDIIKTRWAASHSFSIESWSGEPTIIYSLGRETNRCW